MRRSFAVVAAVAAMGIVSGCGDDGGDSAVPAPSASGRLTVTSSAFTDGGTIPRRHTCDGEDVSPPLDITGVPAKTAELALLVEDPDAPHGTFTHWLVWGVDPKDTRWPAGEAPSGATQGRNGFGKDRYGGPCPPKGKPHHYVFTAYATDKPLGLTTGASANDVKKALKTHALASGTLTGRYGR
jgi:hypothetical protein